MTDLESSMLLAVEVVSAFHDRDSAAINAFAAFPSIHHGS